MRYEEKTYYKIGRTEDLGKREIGLKISNPFLVIIAKKVSFRYEKEEKEIHDHLKPHHFKGEWFQLTDEQYIALFNDFHFEDYSEQERLDNLRRANIRNNDIGIKPASEGLNEFDSEKTRLKKTAERLQYYHVFRKSKILKGGKRVYRWYYYFIDQNGKKIQKACRGCSNRQEAYDYILSFDNTEVN